MRSDKVSFLHFLLPTVFCLNSITPSSGADAVDEAALRNAYALYCQQKYAISADAFELLLRKSTPNARLYYYAALANKGANRTARAKQLCQYVIANFSSSAEAKSARTMFDASTAAAASVVGSTGSQSDSSGALPAELNGKTFGELMQTEEGRQKLKEALSKQKLAGVSASSASSVSSPQILSSASVPQRVSPKLQQSKDTQHVFDAASVSESGADGITQFSYYPPCWFESAMAALAILPRGQQMLAQMIRTSGADGTCVVRFPNDGIDYLITPKKLEESRLKDKALWASLIHCAATMKFKGHMTGSIEDGLTCLTGKKSEKLFSANTTEQSLIAFVGDAIKSQQPVVCLAADDIGTLPELTESEQAYTIIDFDPATKMITLRNPHGDNSRRFRLTTDPEHRKFEQLNNGIFKMHVSIFPQYFSQVARSSL